MSFADPISNQSWGAAVPPAILVAADPERGASWWREWQRRFPQSHCIPGGKWPDDECRAIANTDRPALIVAHGERCHEVMEWAARGAGGSHQVLALCLFDPTLPRADDHGAILQEGARRELPVAACVYVSVDRPLGERCALRRLAREWRCHFDTIGAQALPPAKLAPLQSLGDRFFAALIGGSRQPFAAAGDAGYGALRRRG